MGKPGSQRQPASERVVVENNFLSKGSPQLYTERFNNCNGESSCEQGVRKDMAKESPENILKLKTCWDAGDTACVVQMRTLIELDEKAFTALRVQDNLAGRAYEDSAKWYADIIDNCNGKCGGCQRIFKKQLQMEMRAAIYGRWQMV